MEDIGALTVLVPPLDEQEQIVEYLHTATHELETAEQQAEREIALLIEFRSRLTSDVVTGKIDIREAAAHLPDVPTRLEEAFLATDADESESVELGESDDVVTEPGVQDEETVA